MASVVAEAAEAVDNRFEQLEPQVRDSTTSAKNDMTLV